MRKNNREITAEVATDHVSSLSEDSLRVPPPNDEESLSVNSDLGAGDAT